MKNLPIGIQSFEKLIKKNCVYVDKTEKIYHLITRGSYYFLSRPRRFGKSLLVSTLSKLFAGNKHLFNGLWISTSNYDWQTYPVIQLNFSVMAHKTAQELKADIIWTLHTIAHSYNITISEAPSLL
jgi:O-acetylhomoserine/O-acetylserine sulfhydrylase-like pyridoxal-dependent enzyme